MSEAAECRDAHLDVLSSAGITGQGGGQIHSSTVPRLNGRLHVKMHCSGQ